MDEFNDLELFAGLSEDQRSAVEAVMKRERHPRGAVLVEEGDLPSKFFVILSGHVTVHRDGGHLADLGPGDFFGEMGVLALESRNASIIATTPVEVAAAMGWDLRKVLGDNTQLRDKLATAAANRTSTT